MKFPKHGTPRSEVLKKLQTFRDHDVQWKDGRVFSLVYHAGDEHTEFLKDAYSIYFHENGLNPGAFPSLKKMEAEVISQCVDLFNGHEIGAVGTMTSGGSESIMMAVKTYRDQARAKNPRLTQSEMPEMIVPISIHPAFEKAAHYFGVKAIHAPVDVDLRVNAAAVEKLITPNTIFIVGSAPSYPHGVVDPIEELGQIAIRHQVGLHVDACIGGFILPFVKKLGRAVPAFDFKVPGVTSISADLHKYGYAAKGASVILYGSADLRRFQFFVYEDWTGGLFASPSMTGTRPGGAIAAAWAALQAFGDDGYVQMARETMMVVDALQAGIQKIPGMKILSTPESSLFAFGSDQLNIHSVGDVMESKGWMIDRQQNPDCLHLTVTLAHRGIVDSYLKDLNESVAYVKAHPQVAEKGMAAIYGMMAKLPEPLMKKQQMQGFLLQYMDGRYGLEDSTGSGGA